MLQYLHVRVFSKFGVHTYQGLLLVVIQWLMASKNL